MSIVPDAPASGRSLLNDPGLLSEVVKMLKGDLGDFDICKLDRDPMGMIR